MIFFRSLFMFLVFSQSIDRCNWLNQAKTVFKAYILHVIVNQIIITWQVLPSGQ